MRTRTHAHTHAHTRARSPLASSPRLLSLAPQKGINLGVLASDRAREKAAREKGHGRAGTPPGVHVRARVCVLRGCACTHTGCQLPFPNRALGNILQHLLSSTLITLSQGPAEPLTQSWVRQERRTGLAGGICPVLRPGHPREQTLPPSCLWLGPRHVAAPTPAAALWSHL